jgi:hypothetical protein
MTELLINSQLTGEEFSYFKQVNNVTHFDNCISH